MGALSTSRFVHFYVIGGRFNAFFPLYIAIVSMGTYGALALLFSLNVRRLPHYFDRLPSTLIGGFFVVTALFFAGLWLSRIDMHLVTGAELDTVSRVVIAIDGVVLLPLLFYGGRALARREPLGYALAGLLLVKATGTFLTLIVNTLIAARWGREADGLETVAYGIGFVGALTLLVWFLECVDDDTGGRLTSPSRDVASCWLARSSSGSGSCWSRLPTAPCGLPGSSLESATTGTRAQHGHPLRCDPARHLAGDRMAATGDLERGRPDPRDVARR